MNGHYVETMAKVLPTPDDYIGPGWEEGAIGGSSREFWLGEPDNHVYYTKQCLCKVCGDVVSNKATYCKPCAAQITAFKRRVVAASKRRTI